MANRSKRGLILAHNQSMKFNDFFAGIQGDERFFDYSGYSDLLFVFNPKSRHPAAFVNLDTGRKSFEYGGAYVTGYAAATDLAFAAAVILDSEKIPVADSELRYAPSLSKISEMAKLMKAGVRVPKTYGGTKVAMIRAFTTGRIKLSFPLVFKAADGERGVDNYTIYNENEIYDLLQNRPDDSIWIAQDYIESGGF